MPDVDELLARYDDTAALEDAWTIPGTWYTDARIADREKARVWGRTWQLVARADQVASPGQYATAEIAGEPIIVVRGNDGVLRAFFNVCRHHAAVVMTAPCGTTDRLRCPYHGWTYDLTGRLRGVPEIEGVRGFDRDAMGLVPVAVEQWEQLVFVNLARQPAPLAKDLEPMSALGLGRLQFCERREYVLNCNWKVFIDNYLDGGYHVPHLHAALGAILTYTEYRIHCFERGCLQSSPIERSDDAVRRGRALYYWLYPNLMLNWYEGYLDTNLVLPISTDKTRVIFDFYFAELGPSNAESIAVSDRIQQEDHAICESVQRGVASRAYDRGRLSVRREAGEHRFHQLLARDLR